MTAAVLLWQESLRNKISRRVRYANVPNDIAEEADLSPQSAL